METKRRKRKPICRRHMVKPETVLKQNWKREEILNTLNPVWENKNKNFLSKIMFKSEEKYEN
jgi:hypothetical protein